MIIRISSIIGGMKIKNIILRFQSMTYAIKAQKKLKLINVNSDILKITENDEYGCTYGISIPYKDYYAAVNELNSSGISFKTYSEKKD